MAKITLEIESRNVTGAFGDSLGAFGYTPDNPEIVEVAVTSEAELAKRKKYLDGEHLLHKVNGTPFNGADW